MGTKARAKTTANDDDDAVDTIASGESKHETDEADEDSSDDEDDMEEDVFLVENVLDHKMQGGNLLFQVKWVGYDISECTWEPLAHFVMPGSQGLVKQYMQERGLSQHDGGGQSSKRSRK
jgi:hypothetical protein